MSTSAIIISYGEDPQLTRAAVDSLRAQDSPPSQIIIVDNYPGAPAAAAFAEERDVKVVVAPHNGGFTGGVALGAAQAVGEFLLLLNPDAELDPGCLAQLQEVASAHPHAAIVGAQILLPDGTVNAGENPLHLSGLSWSGRYGRLVENTAARPVLAVSGAAMLLRARAYAAIGGISEHFFLYCEDTDLCWRARLAGYEVWFAPRATAVHHYEFGKGTAKYRHLERNRLAMLYANYSTRTLLLLSPLLVATEVAVWLAARRGGWVSEKLASYGDLLGERAQLQRWRKMVQTHRMTADRELLAMTAARIDTPFLPIPEAANRLCAAYRRLLLICP